MPLAILGTQYIKNKNKIKCIARHVTSTQEKMFPNNFRRVIHVIAWLELLTYNSQQEIEIVNDLELSWHI